MRFASAWKIQHAKNICNMKVKQPERSQSLRGGRPEIKKKQKKTLNDLWPIIRWPFGTAKQQTNVVQI